MFDISILCPTKNRCEGLERMWLSAMNTADLPNNIELVVYIENDDHNTLSKVEEFEKKFGNQIVKIVSSEDVVYGDLHNICCANSSADLFFCGADDMIFRTQAWDTSIKEVFKQYNISLSSIGLACLLVSTSIYFPSSTTQ